MDHLRIPWRRCIFEQLIWQHRNPQPRKPSIDEHFDDFLSPAKSSAPREFGGPVKTPRQPWGSPSTWTTLKYAVPLRRSLQLLRSIHRGALVRTTWVAWRSRLHAPFIPGDEGIITAAMPGLRGWAARACLPELHHTAMRLRNLTAAPQYTLCL